VAVTVSVAVLPVAIEAFAGFVVIDGIVAAADAVTVACALFTKPAALETLTQKSVAPAAVIAGVVKLGEFVPTGVVTTPTAPWYH
jgi:hypothetical protein